MTKTVITKEDVLQVANTLKKELNEQQILWVLFHYREFETQDPTGTWNLIVEQAIYSVLDLSAEEVVADVFKLPEENSDEGKWNFYLDQKVTTWKRTHFSVVADSLEKAKELAIEFYKKGNCDGLGWVDVDGVDEPMTVEDNNGLSTEELFTETCDLIINNGEEDKFPQE